MELPLFPLHSVLCPGVALPLHIFEPRYRALIGRCIDRSEPFGVVLIRDGRDTGAEIAILAEIGTTALIREAGRYTDGRMEIMTVGGSRFRIDSLSQSDDGYLVGKVSMLEEPIGDRDEARRLAQRVSRRFLRYLELLQPALADEEDGPEIEIEIEVESDEPAESGPETASSAGGSVSEPRAGTVSDERSVPDQAAVEKRSAAPEGSGNEEQGAESEGAEPGSVGGQTEAAEPTPLSPDAADAASQVDRHELLMAAARRLAVPDDPTALSYVLGGLVQVELGARQSLLEAPDTESRLRGLDSLLGREIDLLGKRLKPFTLDPRTVSLRRN
ncbi:MAG: LON peptidase substrate-binding domain-containing protein [Chloroflexi bacterium]|nr:LON peptidase substrate-binding domain-containing protein [Chloroflexota bacterium]